MSLILSQPIENVIQIFLASSSVVAAFVAVNSYRSTRKKELAKQKDLDITNENVMDHDKRIGEIERCTPFKSYVDQQDRAIHKRIDGIEKRADDNIKDLHKDVKEILKLLVK